ncbi:SDR family NAD(P)-dependent oxidoreductase [Pseudoroseicyclus aestuarii]|uniref:7-alpha-hydroxysteroid dehydrogenase n=1 Tax=Pseudoroseicyclus aestuarii TaxID=1795041 RepID=A0A318SU76_9RHOB|nr:SDR family oxidoreductase [Pseudoroseicyclus aestuarii]PYE85012.1 7-alpha-hydroxysteroid dehydrogenase [Pseudoroseicyclus aestuarii]
MSFSVAGKTAIVTGAAHGVGLAIARALLEAGANVVLVDRDEEALEREAGPLREAEAPVRHFAGDLRERLTVTNLLSFTVDAFDRIDILVNASRQMMPTDPLDPEDETVDALMAQNMTTALRLSQATARRMIKLAHAREDAEDAEVGCIVNLSSIAARLTHPRLLGYSISCAALEQMTRSLAVALAPKHIRVNAVAFGSVLSASLESALQEDDAMRSSIVGCTPLGRIASPGEVSDAVQYLASGAAAFVTGQVITVDGGRSLLDAALVPAH